VGGLFNAVRGQQVLHAPHGQLRLLQQAAASARRNSSAKVGQAAGALLAADHGEVTWWPFSQAMNTTPVL
jgi:hypothetical protein